MTERTWAQPSFDLRNVINTLEQHVRSKMARILVENAVAPGAGGRVELVL